MGARSRPGGRAVRGALALILLCGVLALPALPVHADAKHDLFEAAIRGTVADVKAALAAGADPGAREEDGFTALHLAARYNANPSVVEALIEGGADPGGRDDAGNTAFVYLKENPAFEALRGTETYRLLKQHAGG